jgi:hypothetical protein
MPPPPQPIVDATIYMNLDAFGIPILNQPFQTTLALPESQKDDFYIKRLSDEEQKTNRAEMLAKPDELCFLSPMLEGYALKNKTWRKLPVENCICDAC